MAMCFSPFYHIAPASCISFVLPLTISIRSLPAQLRIRNPLFHCPHRTTAVPTVNDRCNRLGSIYRTSAVCSYHHFKTQPSRTSATITATIGENTFREESLLTRPFIIALAIYLPDRGHNPPHRLLILIFNLRCRPMINLSKRPVYAEC
ncbi:hypothetical protein BDM02DRAFT_597606 [Thelephora ganbajun]|uniref:Uncharacterized protein n=1 Tax=Thelephora ganbajun TaxID=370292 RepID=A0ACB6Z6T8_THEGA|nr:hypothetical protein BDM02DRAFT_597606 [Thelephora ganbajun]